MDLNEEELQSIGEAFKEMGVKPKAQSKEDFQKWLLEYSKGAKPKATASASVIQEHQMTSTIVHPPRLPNFSGDKKGETTFDLWKFEVECLMKEKQSDATISQAIRRSLRGEAARVVMRLGSAASTSEILEKIYVKKCKIFGFWVITSS